MILSLCSSRSAGGSGQMWGEAAMGQPQGPAIPTLLLSLPPTQFSGSLYLFVFGLEVVFTVNKWFQGAEPF